jgi:hypothetical protein
MNTRRLSFGLLFTFATALAACGGEAPPPETPPPPPPAAPEPPAAPAEPAAAGPGAEGPAGGKKEEPAPAPKAAKDKVQGKWGFDFSGEVRAKAEEDAKKKAGAADKDGKKFQELMKKEEDKHAKQHMEVSGDTWTVFDGDKPVMKVHYDIGKDEGSTLTIKLGKDEVTKKDWKGQELVVSFKDDNTISVPDPKDAKKAPTSYKRQ